MAEDGLYERVLTEIGGRGNLPEPKPPRPSAAVVPWRRSATGEVEVFLVRRAEELAFMGGWHAFPGGGLSRSDAALELAGEPQGSREGPPLAGLPDAVTRGLGDLGGPMADGLVACALRELFEEVGILPLVGEGLELLRRHEAEEWRRALVARDTSFAELLAQHRLRPDPAALVYAGRWLTPPLGPIRFDNRFFLLEWPASRAVQPRVIPGEIADGEWVRPRAASERWARGEILTAPPILHILRVLAEEGPTGGLARLRDAQEANLGPHRAIEFRPGVLMFPLVTPTLPPASYTNCYLLGYENGVLIDPGSPYEREVEDLDAAVTAARDRLGRHVRAIWLTHHHPDHVGGVAEMARRLGVPVHAHELTAAQLEGKGISIAGTLEPGTVHDLGGPERPFPVRLVHTPGHARGHLCFFDENLRSAIVGDMIAGFGTIVIDPPEGNMDDYLDSLRLLRDLDAAALFPAHGPVVKQARAKLDEYIEHRQWREGRIAQAWAEGVREPDALLDAVYDDVPEVARPLARRQLLAHLERLRGLDGFRES